ncbi:hypothetical protein RKLH11_627 [Rhodobacteraceae bacterium KLH11]|nr:hypothetical protein RKLH11_627 [Rhodobacteraceae bacterium KLH11]
MIGLAPTIPFPQVSAEIFDRAPSFDVDASLDSTTAKCPMLTSEAAFRIQHGVRTIRAFKHISDVSGGFVAVRVLIFNLEFPSAWFVVFHHPRGGNYFKLTAPMFDCSTFLGEVFLYSGVIFYAGFFGGIVCFFRFLVSSENQIENGQHGVSCHRPNQNIQYHVCSSCNCCHKNANLINSPVTANVNSRQQKTVVGFGDPPVLRRSKAAPRRGFSYGRAQWERASAAGSVRPVRQPVVSPATLLARGFRSHSNLRRPRMSTNNTLYLSLVTQLADLEDGLDRIGGFCAAYRLLAPELDMEAAKPSTEAFWALLESMDATIGACRTQSDAIHRTIKRGAFQ